MSVHAYGKVTEAPINPVQLAVVQGALANIQQEMTSTLRQSGRSNVTTIARDYSNALFDAVPEMILQGQDLPVHLGSLIEGMRCVANNFGDGVHDGDVFYHSDPTYGGSHLADMCAYKPVFVEGQLAFWAVSKLHVADNGGPVAGTYNASAKDIFAEGLRIPPIRLVDRGVVRQDIWNFILINLRTRENQAGDLRAQLGAVNIAARRLQQLCAKYGLAECRRICDHLKGLADRQMRAILAETPDGTSYAELVMEDIGHRLGDIAIGATVTVTGDRLHVQLKSPPQIPYYINSYFANSISGVHLGIVMWAQLPPPYNQGLYRSITIDCGPKGTLLNAVEPAAQALSTSMPHENIAEVVRRALVARSPRRPIGQWGPTYGFTFHGFNPKDGKEFVGLNIASVVCGAGATTGTMDGWHMVGPSNAVGALTTGDTELTEAMYPFIIHEYGLRSGSAGPGEFRGGLGARLMVEPLTEMDITIIGQGRTAPCRNADGFQTPLPDQKVSKSVVYHADGTETVYEWSAQFRLLPGDRYVHLNPGGGGAGDPLLRDPARVLEDVLDGVISVEDARLEYGVLVDPAGRTVDNPGTTALRSQLRHRGTQA
jgi:N-methylhydantoinase B